MPPSQSHALSYEQQQAELKKIEDGDGLRIEVPKEPEVEAHVYKDVEPLLFRGFLTQVVEINEVTFVIKTLNHHEFEMLRLSTGYEPGKPIKQKFWNHFLAFGVFMVDGVCILPDRDHWIPKIAKMFEELPVSVKNRIIRHQSELNRRSSNAVTITECYAMEHQSRYRWLQSHGLDMTTTAITGISGTERLGMNWAQLTWRAINTIEDQRQKIEHEWDNAKFVGSCSAGKGIQKVYNQDTTRRQKEREELLSRKDMLLRHVILGEPLLEKTDKAGAVWVSAKSVEELTKQLESDLRGEKDWHDAVVDQYESRIRDGYSSRMTQIAEMDRAREEEFGGKRLVGGTETKGLSVAEVRERVTRSRQVAAQDDAKRMVFPEIQDEKLRGALDKYIGQNPSPDAGPRPAPLPVQTVNRPQGRPFRR
jgi:hypothetical protein